ncbi:protein eva-1 homolog C-like isoform 2-T2 [Discoglossus pictus]
MILPYNLRIILLLGSLSACTGAATEFSGYLQKVLKSHTSHACDGDLVTVSCPHKTSISVLSAFYGRRISVQSLCPSLEHSEETTYCSSPTAFQKLSDDCQDRRSCHFSVNSRIFGADPCPGTNKYLLVSYKCKPDNYKVHHVCENDQLRLVCRNNSLLSIYSASFGRRLQGNPVCDPEHRTTPKYECSAQTALRKVFRRCHHRHNCTIIADTHTFGDPCFPGVVKHLMVSYTCIPRRLMEELGRTSADPFSLSDVTHDIPEKLSLYFLCGVSAGLFILLCIFIPKMTFLQDVRKVFWETHGENEPVLGGIKMVVRRIGDNGENDDSSSETSFQRLSHSYRSNNIFSQEVTAALEATTEVRVQGTDEIWLPKEPSPYAIQKIKGTP